MWTPLEGFQRWLGTAFDLQTPPSICVPQGQLGSVSRRSSASVPPFCCCRTAHLVGALTLNNLYACSCLSIGSVTDQLLERYSGRLPFLVSGNLVISKAATIM